MMTCIIIGFMQVNCTIFNYFEYLSSVNMYNSTFITYVALVKVTCHKSVICHDFIANCRKIKSMEVKFNGTASVSGVLKFAEVIQKLKPPHIHIHTQTQTHIYTHKHIYTHTHTHTPNSEMPDNQLYRTPSHSPPTVLS